MPEDNPILKQVSESIDAAYDLAIVHSVSMVEQYMKSYPLTDPSYILLQALITSLNSLKKQ